MRTSPKAGALAAVFLAAFAVSVAAQPTFEFGSSLAGVMVGDDDGATNGLPAAGFGIIDPGVYASLLLGSRFDIEPQIGRPPNSLDVKLPIATIARPISSSAGTRIFSQEQRTQSRQPSWVSRHPVVFGALVGAGVGAVAGATLGSDCGQEERFCSRSGMVVLSTVAGSGAGALVGLVVGLLR